MFSLLWRWFTERWPYDAVKRLLLEEEIPGGASYFFTLGTAVITVFTLQIVSGIVQLFYYVPSVDHAYDSVSYLRTQVPFGWLVHNVHYWGANAMVVLVALHMIRVYIWGGYKTQLAWLTGIVLLLLTMGLSLTGAPLPWDQLGYWAGEVSSGITGTVPVMGDLMKTVLRGGEHMGQLALSRFFVFHVGLLGPFLVMFIPVHIISFRKKGIVGPWNPAKRTRSGPFWPDQVYKDVVTGTVVLFVLVAFSVFLPPAFTGPADILNTTYVPKPEWNFLFLYQALKYFKGPLEPLGTAGFPAFLIGLLVLLPLIDRGEERNPLKRPVAMTSLVLYAGLLLTLTLIGYFSPGFAGTPSATESRPSAASPAPTSGSAKGAALFKTQGCIGCHSIAGSGGNIGPALTSAALKPRTREWLTEQIRNPKSHNPNSGMPAFTSLGDSELKDLVDYLLEIAAQPPAEEAQRPSVAQQAPAPGESGGSTSDAKVHLPGPAAYVIGDAKNGALLFAQQCASCHGKEGKSTMQNPGSSEGTVPSLNPVDQDLFSADPLTFAENLDKPIQHGSTPAGPHPAVLMPAWGDTRAITQQQIANIEAYVMQLNGVDRGMLVNPGMQPRRFFFIVAGLYLLFVLVQGGIRVRNRF